MWFLAPRSSKFYELKLGEFCLQKKVNHFYHMTGSGSSRTFGIKLNRHIFLIMHGNGNLLIILYSIHICKKSAYII